MLGEPAGGFLGSGGVDIEKAMENFKALLREKRTKLGADAVIGFDFE